MKDMPEDSNESIYRKMGNYSAAGLIISFALGIAVGYFVSAPAGIMMVLAGILLCIVPVSVYEYIEYSRYRKMEEHFPTFLEDFAEAKKSGMTFPQAFMSIAKTDYGSLSKEIRKSSHHLSWNVPFPKAMGYLAKRMSGSRLIHQAFTIINEAYSSGGNVAETMTSLATNITRIKQIEDERRSIMGQQVFVIYFIFLLFLGILIGLYQVLIPMTDMGAQYATGASGAAFKGFGFLGKAVDYCASVPIVCDFGRAMGFAEKGIYFKALFLLMSLIQAVSSGVVAGQIGEGTIIAGVKHSGIMVMVTMLSFIIFFS